VVAAWDLRRRTGGLAVQGLGTSMARIALASAVMAGVVAAVSATVPGDEGLALALRVAAAVASGVVVYVAAARALGVDELTTFIRQLRRRPA